MAEAYYVPLLISTGLNLITSLFTSKPTQKAQEPSLRVPKSDYGSSLPRIYGIVRVEGNKFWPDTKERMYRVETSTKTQGGKGFGGGARVETKTVYGTFAVLFAQGHCSLDRIIINGIQIDNNHNFYDKYCTWFNGTQNTPWSEIVAKDDDPYKNIAYKGINYIGVKDLPLEKYGNQIPQQVSAVLRDEDFGANPTLDLVVGDICSRAGLPSNLFDVTELNSIVLRDGLIVNESGEGYRKVLEDLMGFYLFTAIETKEGIIKFKKFDRGIETPIVIPPQDFFPVSNNRIENKLFTKTTEPKSSLPNKVTVKFSNPYQNWDTDEIVEYFEEYTKENNISFDTQIISFPFEVKQRARLILRHLYLTQRNSYTISLPITYISQIELLDLIELPNGEIVQVHQLNLSADYKLEITAKYYSGGIGYNYVPSDPENNRPAPVLSDPTLNLPNIYILDIPQIEDYPPNTLYVCATQPCIIQASIDGGVNFQQSVYHPTISSIANIISPLAQSNGLDTVHSFDIAIESGSFDVISQSEFDTGQGLGLIAKQVNGYWEGELIQYRDVQILSANKRRISYLARNQFNTQFTPTQTKFFLLKSSWSYYSIIEGNAELIGQSIIFRPIVASWQNLATTPTVSVTPVGNAYKPHAPTNLTGIIDNDGNIKIFWEYDNQFSPYNNSQQEETITYEVDILNNNGDVVRTLQSSQKNVIYTVLDRTEDNISSTFDYAVYAISSVVGRGFPLEDELIPVLVDDNIFSTGEGIAGIKFIYSNYVVTENDINYILVVINPNPSIIKLTFPPHSTALGQPDLSNGFTCYVISEKNNNNIATVELVFNFTYTALANNYVTTGNSVRVFHVSQGKFFVFGNASNLTGYEKNVINITGTAQLESNTLYEVIAPATLTFPSNPIRGDLIHIVDSPGTFSNTNFVTLIGNGYTIEGVNQFILQERDENIQFYFNGFQWIYISRFYYLDVYQLISDYFTNGGFIEGSGINIDVMPPTPPSTYNSFSFSLDYEAIDDRVASLLVAGTGVTLNYNDTANTLTINADAISEIGEIGEIVDDRVANLLVAGTGVTLNYNDTANTFSFSLDYEAIDDRVASLLVAGTGVTLNYNDTANTFSFSLDYEAIDDRVASLLVAGTGVTLNYNDTANTLTINSDGGVTLTLSKSISTNYTLLNSDYKYWIKASGNITITMQSSPMAYFEAIIQNVGTETITLSGISNSVGTKLTTRWTACHVYYDGSSWTAVGALSV